MSPLSRRIYKTLVFSRFYIENRERYTMFKSIVIELRCQRPPVSFLLEKKLNLENHLKTNIGNIFTTWNIFGGNFSLFSDTHPKAVLVMILRVDQRCQLSFHKLTYFTRNNGCFCGTEVTLGKLTWNGIWIIVGHW